MGTSRRPLAALHILVKTKAVEFLAGQEALMDIESFTQSFQQPWFRAAYDAVEYWYFEQYGELAMTAPGNEALTGTVMIRGIPYPASFPANRNLVETVGETSWVYFEEHLSEDEELESFISPKVDLQRLDPATRTEVFDQIKFVGDALRYIEFRRVTYEFRTTDTNPEVQPLIQTTLTLLNKVAIAMNSERTNVLGPAWSELQLANESALKAVIQQETGTQPHIHSLPRLLAQATELGVSFETDELVEWPPYRLLSSWRYGQGNPPGLKRLYNAYNMSLRLISACMACLDPGVDSGFAVLVQYSPWSAKDATGTYRT